MKIALIGPTYPYKGGISHFTTLLADHLRSEHTLDLISWKRQYPAFLCPVDQKDTSSNPVKTQADFILDYANPFSWLETAQKIKEGEYDLLIITWVTPVQAPIYFFIAALVRRLSGTKIGFICHNVLPHERRSFDLFLTKLAFSQADYFMVHSDEEGKEAQKLTSKPFIIGFHPTVGIFKKATGTSSARLFRQLKLKKKVLLFFGNIRPYKGLDYLIKALPLLLMTYPDLSVLVAGEFWGGNETYYRNLVKTLNLEEHVVFVNKYIPNEDVSAYFAVSDLVVLPYVSATQSGVIQIAYSCNKPVISTAVGGLKDVIEDGKTGYFVKSKNPQDIADKVIQFYEKGINAMDIPQFINKWSWEKYADLLLSGY